jgi:imidazole glycerol-phosphate synthase subunit HisH
MIALIDYGSGNLRSVSKALEREGAKVRLVRTPFELDGAEAVVLPGVGAFGDSVRTLKQRQLWDPLQGWLEADKPFLGICLGYQLLFESSEESPGERGFGHFRGEVKRFTTRKLKVPQIGWNSLQLTAPDNVLWRGLPNDPYVYFVHSFFPAPEDQSLVIARAEYDESFAAAAARGNIAAVQFHPEKSQEIGLTILRNFIQSIQ